MNRIYIFLVSALVSTSGYASCDNADIHSPIKLPGDISLNFNDALVSEVVAHINSECKERMKSIEVKNPAALITLNFEAIGCESAAAIIKDYDSREE